MSEEPGIVEVLCLKSRIILMRIPSKWRVDVANYFREPSNQKLFHSVILCGALRATTDGVPDSERGAMSTGLKFSCCLATLTAAPTIPTGHANDRSTDFRESALFGSFHQEVNQLLSSCSLLPAHCDISIGEELRLFYR